MANSNRTKRTNGVKKRTKQTLEISNLARIILIVTGILLLLVLLTESMGGIGFLVRDAMLYLLGNAAYILPILLILLAINSYLNSIKTSDIYLIVAAVVILFLSSILLDSVSEQAGIYRNRFYFGSDITLLATNGGIMGAFINSFMLKAFGTLGLNIIVITLLAISLVIFFNLDYEKIAATMFAYTREGLSGLKDAASDSISKAKEERSRRNELTEPEERTPKIVDSSSAFKESENRETIINYHTQNKARKIEMPSDELLRMTTSEEEPKQRRKEKIGDKVEIEKEIKQSKSEEKKYVFPPISLLNKTDSTDRINKNEILQNSRIIEDTMANFGIEARVEQVNSGPTITCYELVPAPNVKLSKIVGLADNLSFSLASPDIRIEAPIPGKTAVGIEVPNKTKSMVTLEEVINSKAFDTSRSDLPLVLGKDASGQIIISSIEDMPHLLIAGATGSGKSVCINGIILSLLYKSSPEDLRLILVDPKIVELSIYNSIPHLLIPVVTNPKKAASTLAWAVEEMERRYKLFAQNSVKDLKSYNAKMEATEGKLPKIVIIIDELADLMMVASNEVEDYIARLAQMARAAGMHLVLATQRPSVDVITGTIKANIPSRISFSVSSQIDSRTILDMAGAEKLLGKGDMLFYPSFYSKPKRIQGAFVTSEEVEKVIDFFKTTTETDFSEEVIEEIETVKVNKELDLDPLMMDAIKLIVYDGQASISYLQRKLKIGYSRAARIVDQMEEQGFVGKSEGSKPRTVNITEEDYLKLLGETIE